MKTLTFLKNKIIANRGAYDNIRIYENTIASIDRAIKNDLIISLDVRILKDNTLICFADSTLDRLLHVEEKLEKITIDDLDYYAKYNIPTLADALEEIGGKVPVIINLRSSTKKHIVEKKILELIKDYKGEYTIQTKHLDQLKYIHKKNPDIVIGYVLNKKNYYDFILFHDYDYVCIDSILVSEKHAKNLKEKYFIIGYGVKNQEQYDNKRNSYDALVCDNVLDIKPY